MRILITLISFVVILSQLHWTQHKEHTSLLVNVPCLPTIVNTKADGNHCIYNDVTVDGSIFRQELDITAQDDTTFSVQKDQILSMSWPVGSVQSSFTWRTYLLLALWLGIAIWSVIPNIKMVGKWTSTTEESKT